MRRENLSGSQASSRAFAHRQSAFYTKLSLLLHVGCALRFNHLQSYGASALLTAVTVLSFACTRAPSLHSDSAAADSLTLHISSPLPYKQTLVLIYKDSLTQPLEAHYHFGSENFVRLPADDCDRIVAAIADLPGEIAEERIPDRFSALEQVSMNYCDENPEAPLQAGYSSLQGSGRCELSISPLLCRIELGEISLQGDAPLKDPVVQLINVNAVAQIFRHDGFHPSITLDDPSSLSHPMMMLQVLPFDIGSSPQKAGISLWCYPNENSMSPSILRITGWLSAELVSYDAALPQLGRGSRIMIDIRISDGEMLLEKR